MRNAPHTIGRRRTFVLVGLIALALVGATVSAMNGQLTASAADVMGSILHGLGIDTALRSEDALIEQTLLQIRFPRIALSLLVGAALAVAGAVMQSIFGNEQKTT